MKKCLVLAFMMVGLLSSEVFSQPQFAVDKGSFGIAGTASFNSQGEGALGGNRATTINISPSLIYFLVPGLGVGGSFDYSRTSGDLGFDSFGIGPTAAYYFGGKEARTFPVVRFKYLYRFGDNDLSEITTNQFQFSIGSTFMLAKNVGLLTEAFYTYNRDTFKWQGSPFFETSSTTSTSNALGIRVGIDLFVF